MQFSANVIEEANKKPNYWENIFRRHFNSEDGKKILVYLFQASAFFEVSADKNVELFNSGRRALMMEILSKLKIDPIDATIENDTNSFLDEILKGEKEND